VIGWVGSTGNSTGPHLHLATRWNRASFDGRSYERKTIDPERVLMVGAVDAASEQGLGFGSPARPHLAIPMYTLGTISGSNYASPVPVQIAQAFTASVAESQQPDPEPPYGSNAGVRAFQNLPEKGLTPEQVQRREALKQAAKESARRVAPEVAEVALTAALASVGVPPAASQTIAGIFKSLLEQNPSGSPAELVGQVRATVPDWGMPLDEADKVLIQVSNWISENIQ